MLNNYFEPVSIETNEIQNIEVTRSDKYVQQRQFRRF